MRLLKLALKLLETYSLEEILEMNDLTLLDVIITLLDAGLINPEAPAIVDLDVN